MRGFDSIDMRPVTLVASRLLSLRHRHRRTPRDSSSSPLPLTTRVTRFILRAASSAVLTLCAGNTFFTVVGYPACVVGGSMRPALNEAHAARATTDDSSALSWLQLKVNWVFVNCWKARRQEFDRGEIVVFVSPKGQGFFFCLSLGLLRTGPKDA